ncbi:protein of unknown function (plasmid) [Cupriavidus taiwanensis]|uniref:Uncharacterized protein n=1 Tax=Cupriavidus taiwanensis TaxID=164546 RepID=A0A375IU05_9BURK|nr:protein of unknown function [Cupriavidus taiwanensis]
MKAGDASSSGREQLTCPGSYWRPWASKASIHRIRQAHGLAAPAPCQQERYDASELRPSALGPEGIQFSLWLEESTRTRQGNQMPGLLG